MHFGGSNQKSIRTTQRASATRNYRQFVLRPRNNGSHWNIWLKLEHFTAMSGIEDDYSKCLGCAIGVTWPPNHHCLRVGSNSFWLIHTLLHRTVK